MCVNSEDMIENTLSKYILWSDYDNIIETIHKVLKIQEIKILENTIFKHTTAIFFIILINIIKNEQKSRMNILESTHNLFCSYKSNKTSRI